MYLRFHCFFSRRKRHRSERKNAPFDTLAIDDFGLMALDLDTCRNLFDVIDRRDGKKSAIIISQLSIKSWFDLFHEYTFFAEQESSHYQQYRNDTMFFVRSFMRCLFGIQ